MQLARLTIRPLVSSLLLTLSTQAPAEPDSAAQALPAPAQTTPTPAATAQQPASNSLTLQPFTVHYKTRYEMGWFSFDIAGKRQLQQLDEQRWRFSFDAEASIATLHESSEFILQEQQIQPLYYRYQTTGLLDKPTQTVVFAPAQQLITDAQNNRLYPYIWQSGLQDNLSYMLQLSLDLAQGKTELSYPVFDKNKVREQRFAVMAEESLNTALGTLQTLKVQQVRDDNKRQIYAWFAPAQQYQMIRLAYYEKGKLRYQIDVSAIE